MSMDFFMGFENATLDSATGLLFHEIGYCKLKEGMGVRATGLSGSSDMFLRTAMLGEKTPSRSVEIFLESPKEIKGREFVGTGFYLYPTLPNYIEATDIAQQANPHWKHLPPEEKNRTVRLVFQFLGLTLKKPCAIVFCYFDPEQDRSMEWFLPFAKSHGAKLYNLYDVKLRHRVEDWVMDNTLF